MPVPIYHVFDRFSTTEVACEQVRKSLLYLKTRVYIRFRLPHPPYLEHHTIFINNDLISSLSPIPSSLYTASSG